MLIRSIQYFFFSGMIFKRYDTNVFVLMLTLQLLMKLLNNNHTQKTKIDIACQTYILKISIIFQVRRYFYIRQTSLLDFWPISYFNLQYVVFFSTSMNFNYSFMIYNDLKIAEKMQF